VSPRTPKELQRFFDEHSRMYEIPPIIEQELKWYELHAKPLLNEEDRMKKYMAQLSSTPNHIADMMGSIQEQIKQIATAYEQLPKELLLLKDIAQPSLDDFKNFLSYIPASMDKTDVLDRTMPAYSLVHDAIQQLANYHESWKFQDISSTPIAKPFWEDINKSISAVVGSLQISTRQLASFDIDYLASHWLLRESFAAHLRTTFHKYSISHEALLGSIRNASDIVALPKVSLPGASRELFTTGHALKKICPVNEDEANQSDQSIELSKVQEYLVPCIQILKDHFPPLVKPYLGAYNALRSRNPDRGRHVLTSLRELVWHLLRILAPDEIVLPWIQSRPEKGLIDKKKPTRRARILYIYRHIEQGPLTTFINMDVDMSLELINLFNELHNIEPYFTDQQLKAIIIKTESLIMYMIQLHRETN